MKPLLSVLSGNPLTPPPLWLMRQAGRYLPEYRELREKAGDFLSLCLNPDMAAEVTLQPVRRFGVDAAILFSDILVVPYMLGQEVTYQEGEGPKLGPLDIQTLKPDPQKIAPIYETVKKVKSALPENCTLIGFAGSPWTVACYMIEGKSGTDFPEARRMSRADPAAFEKIMDKVIDATLTCLEGQIEAGAEVIQLFDSWAGKCDNPQRWVMEPTAAIVMILKAKYPHIPIIGFPRNLGPKYLNSYAIQTSVNAVSLDQSADLAWAATALPKKVALQGNLDPDILREGGEKMEEAVKNILHSVENHPFIFNLGHGINKETPPENVARLVELVRRG